MASGIRNTLEPAYVLHSRAYRETSVLLEVLTRSGGRVGLVARGARGARSRWKGSLQPFRPLLIGWSQRGELGTLTAAEQIASPPALMGETLICGLYTNELVVRFLQRSDPQPELFDSYARLLGGLSAGDPPHALLRLFELQLLESAGFGLQLDHEHDTGQAIEPERWYEYVPESGPIRREAPEGGRTELVSGAALLALKSGHIESAQHKELRGLMRRLLRFYLGERPLKAQSLFF
jgi:DNA repair protein RecO (recombination protein O)